MDAANEQTDCIYDAVGRIISTVGYIGANGTGTALTSAITYIDSAQPKVTLVGPAPHNEKQERQYDQAGRLTASTIYTDSGTAQGALLNISKRPWKRIGRDNQAHPFCGLIS